MMETDGDPVSDLAALFFLTMEYHLLVDIDGVDYVILHSSRNECQRVIGKADKIIVSRSK